MEKYIKISTEDWFEIKGILNLKEKSDILIIFVHGFTGSMWEAHYYSGKEYFTQKWYDVFRFNFYSGTDRSRKMRDCSVGIHSQDIHEVAEYFSEYKKIIFVWHSLAWPCLAGVSSYPDNVYKLILWDPAYSMKITAQKCYTENEKIYIQASWKHLEVSKVMYREFEIDNFLQVLENQNFPKNRVYAIYADGDRHIDDKPKSDAMWIKSYVIEWANHWFTQEWKFEELFNKTLEFIES